MASAPLKIVIGLGRGPPLNMDVELSAFMRLTAIFILCCGLNEGHVELYRKRQSRRQLRAFPLGRFR